MQNIDPILILQPAVVIAFSAALLVYWHFKRTLRFRVILYSLIAYAVAIALKEAVQVPTAAAVISAFGFQSLAVGAYYGMQTVAFEVGLAYVVAWYAASKGRFDREDAEGYGLGLAFWENAVFLGLLALINLVAIYVTLALNTPFAPRLYQQLQATQPGLFQPAAEVLPLVGWGILERVSSLLVHFAWGYLCIAAAVSHKKKYFLIALPMGLVDVLVPFANLLTVPVFEVIVLGIGVASVTVALWSTRPLRSKSETAQPDSPTARYYRTSLLDSSVAPSSSGSDSAIGSASRFVTLRACVM